ncbi:fasciclin domain-containing protein [soil metagenome]
MKTFLRRAVTPFAVFSLTALGLAACGDRDKASVAIDTPASSSRTLGTEVKGAADLSDLRSLVENAGLEAVLDGTGPYTVFAPLNSAFAASGGVGDLSGPGMRAQGAALIRAHIVPGALSRRDIGAAIDGASDGSAQMRTMAGGLLTFTRAGQSLVVTAEDGATARLTAGETVAGNGMLQPVDAVLVKAAPG